MPDYIFMLESRLSPEQLQALNQMQQDAQDLGLNLYLVGGGVRDLMTGSPIRDLDFVVEGNPARLVRRLGTKQVRRLSENPAQRTAEVILGDGVHLSVEMARTEFYSAPGRAPQVASAAILEDLRRRDFSLNAMGISLTPGSRGLLLDPTNGLADIVNRELRVLHNYSFVHDPLRLLRLVRFSVRLGFRPEARTQEMFDSALERRYQDSIQPGPLGREVEEIARETNAVAVLKALAERELLAVLHPLLQKRKPDYDGLSKLQRYCEQAQEAGYSLETYFLALHYMLRRLKPRVRKSLLRKLGLKKEQLRPALGLEREARQVVRLLGRRRNLVPRQIYHLLSPIAVELLVFVLAEYSDKKKVQAKIYNYLFKYRPLRQRLPVRELQLMGMPPGPKFDQILEKYFEAQLDGKLRDRAEQLRFLRKQAGLPKAVPKPAPKPPARKEKEKKAAVAAAAPAEPAKALAAASVPAEKLAPPAAAPLKGEKAAEKKAPLRLAPWPVRKPKKTAAGKKPARKAKTKAKAKGRRGAAGSRYR